MYAVASLGLTLIWGVLKVLNFSHGAFITLGGYLAWMLLGISGGNYSIALPGSTLTSFFLGFILYRIIILPLQGKKESEVNIFVATLATGIILENLIIIFIGARVKALQEVFPGFTYILGATVSNQQIFFIIFGPLCLAILLVFLAKTRLGMAVRAVAQDNVGATIVGIESKKIYAYTVAIGSALAGLAGILLGAYYKLTPQMGGTPLITALFVMVLGGMGSIKGTIYGSYIIGTADAFARFFLGEFWAQPTLFAIFILIIIFRPQGLCGVK
jgi:branched-chain amino acid transport system permease protein